MTSKSSIPAAKRKQVRILMIAGMLTVLAVTVFLMLRAFEENIVYFVTPSDLQDRVLTGEEQFRLGGLVEDGTVLREQGTLKVTFLVTDGGASTLVVFEGILPDLFREGQGVVVEGRLSEKGVFNAHNVLAKHDENYMPAEVAEALKKQGHWKDEEGYGNKP
ncbi:MAG: cytochrome c maturation protein CcmE [Proteobacteria bacterium]|nr:cytochrome c maturation protein CcmE [Pseudomonadota bacterium]